MVWVCFLVSSSYIQVFSTFRLWSNSLHLALPRVLHYVLTHYVLTHEYACVFVNVLSHRDKNPNNQKIVNSSNINLLLKINQKMNLNILNYCVCCCHYVNLLFQFQFYLVFCYTLGIGMNIWNGMANESAFSITLSCIWGP